MAWQEKTKTTNALLLVLGGSSRGCLAGRKGRRTIGVRDRRVDCGCADGGIYFALRSCRHLLVPGTGLWNGEFDGGRFAGTGAPGGAVSGARWMVGRGGRVSGRRSLFTCCIGWHNLRLRQHDLQLPVSRLCGVCGGGARHHQHSARRHDHHHQCHRLRARLYRDHDDDARDAY